MTYCNTIVQENSRLSVSVEFDYNTFQVCSRTSSGSDASDDEAADFLTNANNLFLSTLPIKIKRVVA